MKKILFCLFVIAVVCSCYLPTPEKRIVTQDGREYYIVVVDSCEYIFRCAGYKGYMAHKGNCKYCAERRKRELEQLKKELKSK